jgi:hypothetical protein
MQNDPGLGIKLFIIVLAMGSVRVASSSDRYDVVSHELFAL